MAATFSFIASSYSILNGLLRVSMHMRCCDVATAREQVRNENVAPARKTKLKNSLVIFKYLAYLTIYHRVQ
jgi:hypothetical protein